MGERPSEIDADPERRSEARPDGDRDAIDLRLFDLRNFGNKFLKEFRLEAV